MKKDDSVFVGHILKEISDVEGFVSGIKKEEFNSNLMLQKAIVRSVEIIGEAVKNLSGSFRKQYSDVEWVAIAGMRDKLIHNYFGVDLDLVWVVVKKELGLLKKQMLKIKYDLEGE